MIPIKYECSKLNDYNNYINQFISQIENVLNKGYIGKRKRIKVSEVNRKYTNLDMCQKLTFKKNVKPSNWQQLQPNNKVLCPDLILDKETINFFNKVKVELHDWVEKRPDQIKSLSESINSNYPNINNHNSNLYKITHKLFVDHGYENQNFPKDKLIEATGLDVCPYCNRIFINNIEGKDGKQVKGQLDHFYDKAEYPYLAILKYNLVPSCPFCNGPTGKHQKDAEKEGLVNPFMLTNTDAIKFSIDITGEDFTDIKKCSSAISVRIIYNDPKMRHNAKIFHLEEIYQSHSNFAAEMYFKSRMFNTEAYQQFLNNILNENENLSSEEDRDRLVYGFASSYEEFCKKPISKFCSDIINELKILGHKRK